MKGDLQDVKHELAVLLSSTRFTDVLTAIDVEKGVTFATPGPTQVFESERANLDGLGYPVAEIVGLKTSYDTQSQQTKSAVHDLEIRWTHVGDDEQVITAQLERLVRATRDLLWPANGPIGLPLLATWPLVIVSEEYSALFPAGTTSAFIKGSATMLRVATETV